MFVKVYTHNTDALNVRSFLTLLTQEEEIGHFLAIPVKKKRSDDEEDKWTCPYCGTDNPASRNTCANSVVLFIVKREEIDMIRLPNKLAQEFFRRNSRSGNSPLEFCSI